MSDIAKFLVTNQDSFRLLASGVPTVIALFLIVYAHKALSQRLMEATEGGFSQNATMFRRNLYLVWGVALLLLVVHATANIIPAFIGGKHVYIGSIDNLSKGAKVKAAGVARFFAREVPGDAGLDTRIEWVVLHDQPLSALSFDVRFADDFVVRCRVNSVPAQGAEMYLTAHYSLGEGNSLLAIDKVDFLPGGQAYCGPRPALKIKPPLKAPIEDVGADLPDDSAALLPSGLGGLVRPAFASETPEPADLEDVRNALESDTYELRHEARKTLLAHFGLYREWIEEVAQNPANATEREIGAITWVLSRRRPDPWNDLSQAPDVPAEVVTFMLSHALNPSAYVRENVKRFAISYPTDQMQMEIDELVQKAGVNSKAFAYDLQAHFFYNKGVYLVLDSEDTDNTLLRFEKALENLNSAAVLSSTFDANFAQPYAKVDYAKGWVKAVGAREGLGGEFTQASAAKDLNSFLQQVENSKAVYAYPWQIDTAKSYLGGDLQAFD